jgi:hypothetical protein
MEANESFVKELHEIISDDYKIRISSIMECNNIIALIMIMDDKNTLNLLQKYSLPHDKLQIRLSVHDGMIQVQYYFNRIKLDPVSNYILPKDYRQPSVLEILRECVKQNTHKPDIRRLEIGG